VNVSNLQLPMASSPIFLKNMHIYIVLKLHLTTSGAWKIDDIPYVFQSKEQAEKCCEMKNAKGKEHMYIVRTKFAHPKE